jgi:RNA polymerase sigma-70 factor, ECF subfamily
MDSNAVSVSSEFRARLLGFVRRRVQSGADAEDVVQDVLTKLVLRGPETGSVHAWLFTVARNAIIDRNRTQRVYVNLGNVEVAEEAPEGDAEMELANCLCPLMSSLAAEDRRVLERIDMGGESQTHVARELGLSTSGLKSRVQRARVRLRAVLEGCCEVSRDSKGTPTECEKRPGADCECQCG